VEKTKKCSGVEEHIHIKNRLEELCTVIQNLIAADAVYLLGQRYTHHLYENIYQPALAETPKTISFVWILVVAALNNRPPHEWQDRIETHCNKITSVTTLVLDTRIFRQWLAESHPFACFVTAKAKSLFLREQFQRPNPVALERQSIAAQTCLEHGFRTYRAFLAAAELFMLRKENRVAIFMLHQATEHALHAILKANTGFHYCTHNLKRLFAYASLVYEELFCFCEPVKDKKLMEQLNKAYSEARYDESFFVSSPDLYKLLHIVKGLEPLLLQVKRIVAENPTEPIS
jgi:HEPN domain-containing protein